RIGCRPGGAAGGIGRGEPDAVDEGRGTGREGTEYGLGHDAGRDRPLQEGEFADARRVDHAVIDALAAATAGIGTPERQADAERRGGAEAVRRVPGAADGGEEVAALAEAGEFVEPEFGAERAAVDAVVAFGEPAVAAGRDPQVEV